jgi:hypothetical protein
LEGHLPLQASQGNFHASTTTIDDLDNAVALGNFIMDELGLVLRCSYNAGTAGRIPGLLAIDVKRLQS